LDYLFKMRNKEEISEWFKSLQDSICHELEKADGLGRFEEDLWNRTEGGGGRTRVIQNGHIIEKGGVNFSAVYGPTPQKIQQALNLPNSEFYATGVSIVIHPSNPMVPIIHMNVRYFEISNGQYWFGGGIDLTPHFVDLDDAKYFHQQLKHTCDQTDLQYYPRFKKWADDYFYLPHRKETRGIGGIFFDRLTEDDSHSFSGIWHFVQAVGSSFAPIYTHFMKKNSAIDFDQKHKDWQSLRRGRYVEFNLVWDKGTKFGLDTDGRTESILMSMPPMAQWAYDHQPSEDSSEAQTLALLKKDIDWLSDAPTT
jgi:coproporphyrinogen III oxidase